MRYFIDCEFDEHGGRDTQPPTITLISIGIVAEDGRELYCVSNEVEPDACGPWVQQHVFPALYTHLTMSEFAKAQCVTCSRAEIRVLIEQFVGADPSPQFWGYFADHDWVVFCWLWGSMTQLPRTYPKFCRDLKQLAWSLGLNYPAELVGPGLQTKAHNALIDAKWNRQLFEAIRVRAQLVGARYLSARFLETLAVPSSTEDDR